MNLSDKQCVDFVFGFLLKNLKEQTDQEAQALAEEIENIKITYKDNLNDSVLHNNFFVLAAKGSKIMARICREMN